MGDLVAIADESLAGLRAHAAGDERALAREVEYRTSTGAPFRSTVADIVLHVAMHGGHHRGQIATLARQAGATPTSMDYILFAREAADAAARA